MRAGEFEVIARGGLPCSVAARKIADLADAAESYAGWWRVWTFYRKTACIGGNLEHFMTSHDCTTLGPGVSQSDIPMPSEVWRSGLLGFEERART